MASERKRKRKRPPGQGQGEPATAPRRIAAAERRRQALELRKAGATFREIADGLGYRSVSGAHKAVMKALTDIPVAAVEELRTLEGERLDAMQMNLWTRARGGDREAVEQVLKIMARRARLLGLDLPVGLDVTSGGRRLEFTLNIGNGAGHPNPTDED